MNIHKWQQNVKLAPYTTYGIGGPADYLVEVTDQQQLSQAVIEARQQAIPYFILGCGANVLIGDKGFRGLVIRNRAEKYSLNEQGLLTVESGAVMANLVDLTSGEGWSGLEHFAGIPSTVGGALWQNLHFLSPDRQRTVFIAEILQSAKVLLMDNTIKEVGVDYFKFGYDESVLHYEEVIVLEASLALNRLNKQSICQQIEANLTWRDQRQPQLTDYPSCGSVFKKIEGIGAGRLIDQAGLKGRQIGGAKISEQHANFIVNMGGARAADVMQLIGLVQQTIKDELGYDLEMEIGLVGEF